MEDIYYKTCPSWLHEKYRKAVNFTCQRCKKHEKECGKLIPHRLKRKIQGGMYTIVPLNHIHNNIKVVCLECHKLFHGNENSRIKGK